MKEINKLYHKVLKKKERVINNLLGHRDYKKFVIISRSRTGSTLLMALLNKHSNIICKGELFKRLDTKSCLTIWNDLFSKRPKKIKYVGCKIFYYHPFDDDKSVWDFIDNDKNITIIHLTRKNYLEAFVSQKIGEKTKQWSESKWKTHNLSIEDKRVTLNFEECEQTFDKIKSYEEDTLERFNAHPYIEVDYKDLSKNKESTLSSILKQFSLPQEEVEVVNKKQNSEPLEDLIENYKELKQKFASTKWSYLFQ